jgi:hypothetical protein
LWAVFLSGGIFGLLMYRLWTMFLTSLAGVLLAGHAGLLLLEGPLSFDAVAWVTANTVALNGAAVGLIVLGILLQVVASPEEDEVPEKKDQTPEPKGAPAPPSPPPAKEKPAPWWRRLFASKTA